MTPAGYLEAHCDRFVDELHAYVRIPSISTDPAYAGSIEKAARYVAARMESAGLENAALLPTEGHPLVYADWLHAGDAPTVLVYGHYDVQPADPLADWTSPPFEPEVRDDRLYGRGVSDDKGPMFIPVCVAEAFLRTSERLPINLKFVIEGEEEMGSAHLATGVQRYRDRLQADLVLSADGAQWRPDLVSVNVASRGIVSLNLSLTTAAKDLHSGRYGGTVANAAHALGRLVASFHDETGRVAVAGFYDDVRPPTRSEREAMTAIPFDEAAYLAAVGAASPVGEPGYSTLERQWLRPTLDVNGLGCGYQGPGVKTVIPHKARAKISCRLVPDQTPERIRALLKRHCERHAPSGVRLAFADDGIGMPPASVREDHPALAVVEDVLEEVRGARPRRVRMGGSIPIGGIFRTELGIETVFFSFSTGDEDFHAPNEFFRLSSFRDGLLAWERCFERLGKQTAAHYAPFRHVA